MLAELAFPLQRLGKILTGEGKKQAEGPPHKGMKKTPNLRGELVGWGKPLITGINRLPGN